MHQSADRLRPTDWFSREEIATLTRRSNARGFLAISTVWLSSAATLAVCVVMPHPIVWLLAVIYLGNRQLALAVLEHEAAHRTLFRHRLGRRSRSDQTRAVPTH